MKKRTILLITLVFAMSIVAGACAPQGAVQGDETAADRPIQVTVSVLPQAYFVERIGGDRVKVNVMVGPGEDAHTYEPKPDQMIALSQSTLFFSIGIEYEQVWLPRFEDNNPEMEIIDSAAGITRIMETVPHTHDEDDHANEVDNHHDEDDHAHEADDHHDEDDHADEADDHHEDDHSEDFDPHVWLAPSNAKIIARNIFIALATESPADEAYFRTNYEAFIADIEELDNRISDTLSAVTQRKFMVYHPAWGYFAAEYGLTQIPIQIGGTDPSASELAALIDQALDENIRVIFVQPTFSAANAQAIAAEIDGEVAQVDPLARDWLTNLQHVADAFASALNE